MSIKEEKCSTCNTYKVFKKGKCESCYGVLMHFKEYYLKEIQENKYK